MKAIIAYIKSDRLGDVTLQLHKINELTGMTVVDVRGFGRTRAKGSKDLIPDEVADFVGKTRIEIFCKDEILEAVVRTIEENARTGLHGDGKIYVLEVQKALRISTGETGETAV